MNASRCSHWLDLSGLTFDCDLALGHNGKHAHHSKHAHHTGGQGVGDRPRGGNARKNVSVRIEWDR